MSDYNYYLLSIWKEPFFNLDPKIKNHITLFYIHFPEKMICKKKKKNTYFTYTVKSLI